MITQNYDAQELAKFAKLAGHWWDTAGELKTLHQINPLRLSYISQKVNLQGKKVIDIGCGGGILSESLALQGAAVTGIDMNQTVIEVAKLHQLESGTKVEYLHTTAEAIALERPNEYDVITCLEMLEHVPDPFSVIQACAKLAKPGAHLIFSTINRNPKSYLFAILGAEYILKLLPKNTHDYAKFIRPSELAAWARTAQLSPAELQGIAYNPLTQQFRMTNDIAVNYLFYARKESA